LQCAQRQIAYSAHSVRLPTERTASERTTSDRMRRAPARITTERTASVLAISEDTVSPWL
ncbi:hypothetical protein GGH98_005375, partial [Coemansia sp. RSA 454]